MSTTYTGNNPESDIYGISLIGKKGAYSFENVSVAVCGTCNANSSIILQIQIVIDIFHQTNISYYASNDQM